MRDLSHADPWHLPAGPYTRATVTLETAQGVVATVVCEPELLGGEPAGGVGVTVGTRPVPPERWMSPGSPEVSGPLVEVAAGRVEVRRAGLGPPR
jgi:hypothetical protein